MRLLKIKYFIGIISLIAIIPSCKKEKNIPSSGTYQMETSLEILVRDNRSVGAYLNYWGYVFKFKERTGLPDTVIQVLKYYAPTNSMITKKIAMEYTIFKTEEGSSFNTENYKFYACQDSNYYYRKVNTHLANQNSIFRLAPKKTNRIYAEFK
jgi:hypothetical protein